MNVIDAKIGARVARRREALGLSQAALAGRLEISSVDLADFEAGRQRVCVSMLFCLANELQVPIGYFFRNAAPVDRAPPREQQSPRAHQRLH